MKPKIDPYMLSVNQRSKIQLPLMALIIGTAVWILNYLSPEYSDDLVYKFVFKQNLPDGTPIDLNHPIRTFKDIFISQYNHYFLWNGRIIPHILVQFFTGIAGKEVFNYFNAFMFVIFIFLLSIYTKKSITSLNILFITSTVIFLFPSYNETMLWMSGSVNYLWTCTFVCFLLIIITKLSNTKQRFIDYIWVVPSFLIGLTHEGITAPVAGSLVIFTIVKRKTIMNPAVYLIIISFLIGSLLCSFAPATLNKTNLVQSSFLSLLISNSHMAFVILFSLKAFWLFLVLFIIKFINFKGNKGNYLKKFYFENIIECNTIIFSLGIVFISGFGYVRVAVGVEFFSLILILRSLSKETINIRIFKTVIVVASLVFYIFLLKYSLINYNEYKTILSDIKKNGDTLIVSDYYSNSPPIFDNYIVKYLFPGLFHSGGINDRAFCKLHSRKQLIIFPKRNYDYIRECEDDFNLKMQKELYFYVIPIQDIPFHKNIKVFFILRPSLLRDIPFYYIPFASRLDRFTSLKVQAVEGSYSFYEIEGKNFLFVEKNPLIDNRIIEFNIEKDI